MAHILVVDDDPLVCELIESMLAMAGHTVVRAQDGDQARNAVRVLPTDLVMTDIYMPGEDGIGLMRALRAVRPTLPIIVFTGKKDAFFDALSLASKLGADAVLRKPLDRASLLATVDEVLEREEGEIGPA